MCANYRLTTVGCVGVEHPTDQPLQRLPARRVNAVADRHAFDGAAHQPRFFQCFQVLTDGRLRQAQLLHQIAVDAGVRPQQVLNDRYPCRVRQCLRQLRHLVLLRREEVRFRYSHNYIAM